MNGKTRKELIKKMFSELKMSPETKEKAKKNATSFIDEQKPGLMIETTLGRNGEAEIEIFLINCDEKHVNDVLDILKRATPGLYRTLKIHTEDKEETPNTYTKRMVR